MRTCLLFLIVLYTTVKAQSPIVSEINLSAKEQDWLLKHNGTIKLAHDPLFAPFEYLELDGTFYGINVEYINLLKQKTGINFEIVPKNTWEEIIQSAKKQEIDVLGAIVESPQRLEYLNFTSPYLSTRAVIVTRLGVMKELTLSDLQGMRVCIAKDYVWQDYISSDYPEMEVDYVPDTSVGLRKVSFGLSDAMIVGLTTASYHIQKEGYTNLKVAGRTEYFAEYCIAVRKDWPELLSIINKGLALMTSEERDAIHSHWYHHQNNRAFISRKWRIIIALVVAVILIGLIIVLVFNKRLNAKVKAKTMALQHEQQHLLELNKKLVKARDKAKESERLTKAFLTNISHEVRTPMNSIIGFAQLLELEETNKEDVHRYASLMIKGGQQLLSILDSIIHLSKMESGIVKAHKDTFDVYDLLRETHELMQPLVTQSGLSIQLQIKDISLKRIIVSDRLLLQQVINNLISNAIKYTPFGGIVLKAEEMNNELVLAVADTGVGINKEDRDAVFEPFRQVKHRSNIASGAGLGLATAKRIVEVLEGRIWIEENHPQGSIFFVKLPLLDSN